MDTCNKIITEKDWVGNRLSWMCGKVVYKAGLCKHHYTRMIDKMKHWIDRDNYRAATEDDMLSGRSLKLKHTYEHQLFKYKDGKMYQFSSKLNNYIECDKPVDHNIYCVKTN